MAKSRKSRRVYSPSGVSSFFEICDKEPDGSRIVDPLRVGARGGGFIIKRGNTTTASTSDDIKSDLVVINGKRSSIARTSLKVIELMREEFRFGPVRVSHDIEPPIGSGFGTSGAGAVGTAIALSDLFDLRLTLTYASDFAHRAEIESTTGLGTVISLVSGSGAVGLVTEPGCFSVGRVDAIPGNYEDLTLICACFGPIEKSTVLLKEERRRKVNEYGRSTLEAVLHEGTVESLLRHSRIFAEKTGLASNELLKLADKTIQLGALGATQNMIGNAIHSLVPKSKRKRFLESLRTIVPRENIFETDLIQSGPVIM